MAESSSVSEVSGTDQSGAQAAPDAGKSSKLLALGAVFFLCVGAIIATIVALQVVGSGDHSTTEGGGHSGVKGGGSGESGGKGNATAAPVTPTPTPPPTPRQYASETGATVAQKTTEASTTTTLAPAPGAGGTKLLVCVSKSPEVWNNPPDGLCDLVLGSTGDQIFGTTIKRLITTFSIYTASLNKTQGGIIFEDASRARSLAKLKAPDGEKVIRPLWSKNIVHYGTHSASISTSTTDTEVDDLVDFLETLKKLQDRFKTAANTEPLYILVGVAALYKKQPDDSGVIKRHFDNLISKGKPNLVLFETSDLRSFVAGDPGCITNGISVWKDPPLDDQPSFVDALTLRKSVTLPAGTTDLLSMSLCGHVTNKATKKELGDGSGCKYVDIKATFPEFCEGGRDYKDTDPDHVLDTDRLVYIGKNNQRKTVAVFEKKDTIEKKMCKASVDFQYSGGWLMYGLRCHDKQNFCKDTTFTDGFTRLHWMREFMGATFTTC